MFGFRRKSQQEEDQWMWLYENVNLVYQRGHQQNQKLNDRLRQNMCNVYNKGLR